MAHTRTMNSYGNSSYGIKPSRTTQCIKGAFSFLALLLFSFSIYIQFLNWNLEDSYIIYRIVRNLNAGFGWVYNVGQDYNPSTSVLNTVGITLTNFFISDIAQAAHVFCAVLMGFSGLFAYLIFRRFFGSMAGLLAGIGAIWQLANSATWGLETALLSVLVLAWTWREVQGKTSWILLGLAVLARPDALLLVGFKVLYELISKRRIPYRGLITIAVILAPWAIFSLWKFHQIFPATLQNKMWQGRSGFWGTGSIYFHELRSHLFASTHILVTAGLAVIGVFLLMFRKSPLLYLSFFSITQQLAYGVLNVPAYHWYFALFDLSLLLMAGYTAFEIGRLFLGLFSWKRQRLLSQLEMFAMGAILVGSWYGYTSASARQIADSGNGHYLAASNHLNSLNLPEGALAAVEVGTLGYYIPRPIFDFIGLTTPNKEVLSGKYVDEFFQARPAVVVLHSPPWEMEKAVYTDPRFFLMYGDAHSIPVPHTPLQYFSRQLETVPTGTELENLIRSKYPSFVVRDAPLPIREGKQCVVDHINGMLSQGGEVAVGRSLISFDGWAFEEGAKGESSVKILLVGKDINYESSATRLSRPDVLQHFQLLQVTQVGYEQKATLFDLKPGKYKVMVSIMGTDGEIFCATSLVVGVS